MVSIKVELTGLFGQKVISSKDVFLFNEQTTIQDVIFRINTQFGIKITANCLRERDIICVWNGNVIEENELNMPISQDSTISIFQPLAGA